MNRTLVGIDKSLMPIKQKLGQDIPAPVFEL